MIQWSTTRTNQEDWTPHLSPESMSVILLPSVADPHWFQCGSRYGSGFSIFVNEDPNTDPDPVPGFR
jgi:hypothetical protein